jgi:hypothetical protein
MNEDANTFPIDFYVDDPLPVRGSSDSRAISS